MSGLQATDETSARLARLAPAKVNLYLHVAAPDARAYHPLQSLVMFADIGDEMQLTVNKSNGFDGGLTIDLKIDGPFAGGLSPGEDNLIVKAVRRFEAHVTDLGREWADLNIALAKNLPIASGVGGGSADAGAILHLLRRTCAPGMSDAELETIAAGIGADGVMCLWGRTAIAEGYGEKLTPLSLPRVSAILINPLVECSTAAVYKGFDDLGNFEAIEAPQGFSRVENIGQLVAALSQTRNDLQAPAIRLQPVIADVLKSLEAQPETLLARMSGSGATCFALCADDLAAESLVRRLERLWPAAWIRACHLA